MPERNGIVGLSGVGLLALVGFVFVGAPPVAPAAVRSPAPKPSPEPTPPPPDVGTGRRLLRAFFSGGQELPLEKAPKDRETWVGKADLELTVLIATLPDPVDTHLDWLFDSNLDALKRAFESAGYLIDRFWLPWGRGAGPALPFAVPAPLGEAWPGVLLFRGGSENTDGQGDRVRLGLLYVVGESPTSGVHKTALRVALQERHELLTEVFGAEPEPAKAAKPRGAGQAKPEKPVKPVLMVAPVFSGSAESLVRVLSDWRVLHGEEFTLRSGTATALTSRDWLSTKMAEPSAKRSTFLATVHSDASLLKVLCKSVVGPLGLRNNQVAVLKEATTQYGHGQDRMGWSCEEKAGARDKVEDGFLVLPFPMNISGLRAVYPHQPPAAQPNGKEPGTRTEPPRPLLSLTDALRPRETIPTFSDITAPANDIEFDALARVIGHQDVRLVCILATDVRDTLFLASELRRRTRDVQLLTLESNDLYVRSEYGDALRGMLVLSTYPLLDPEARRFRGQRLAFTSGGAQGTYNATMALLGREDELVDYGRRNGGTQAPPVWVTVVGQGGMLPLATASPEPDPHLFRSKPAAPTEQRDDSEGATDRPRRRRLEPASFGVTVLFGIALVFFARWLARSPVARQPQPPPEHAPYRAQRRYMERLSTVLHTHIYAALALLALAGLYLPLAFVVLRRQAPDLQLAPLVGFVKGPDLFLKGPDLFLGTFVGLVGLVGLMLFLGSAARAVSLTIETRQAGLRFALRVHWPSGGQQFLWGLEVAARVAVSLAGIAYAGLLTWYLVWILTLERRSFGYFAVRALQLDGGVSPLLPLACGAAGLASWSIWHLLRIRALAAPGDYELCLAASPAKAPEGVRVRAMRERVFLAVPEGGAVGALLALVFVAVWLASRFSGTLESIMAGGRWTPFDLLLCGTVLAGVCTTAWAVCRLLSTWRALRLYLEALGHTPLAVALGRLPAALPRLARLTPWADARDAISSVALSQLRLVKRLFPPDDKPSDATGNVALSPFLTRRICLPEDKPSDAKLLASTLGLGLHRRLAQAMRDEGVRHPGGKPEQACPHARLLQGSEVQPERRSDGGAPGLGPCRVCRARALAVLRRALQALWRAEPVKPQRDQLEKSLEKVDGKTATSDAARLVFAGPLGLWQRVAEEYLAVQAAGYVEAVLRHLRVLSGFLLLSLLLTTVLLSSYPFQPQGLAKLCFSIVLAGAVLALAGVISDMNRNELLSRLSGTAPGKLTWDLGYLFNLALFAVAPLVTLMGSELPWVRDVFFAWVDPLLRALAKP